MTMNILEAVFWIAAGAVVYIYLGYPLIMYLGSKLRRRHVIKREHEPTISLLIAAHNEVAHIRRTLENSLSLDYDPAKLQIIVVSDGSVDGTDDVVRQFADRGVTLLRQEPRNGKTAALNTAVTHASGDILVFADANSMYERDALRHIVVNFADPSVGYVTGKLRYRNPDGTMTGDGCSLYMRYENFIRTCESDFGSLVGVNGGVDAVRRSLYTPMNPDDLPDLVLPLRVVAQGFRVVYEPAAVLTEEANNNLSDEYRMRVRVSLRAIWTLSDMPYMMSVRRQGFYAIQLFSHKALRYLAFVFMTSSFVTAALLWPQGGIYRVAFLMQLLFAMLAGLGLMAERRGWRTRVLFVPYYFALVNAAAFQACVKFLRRERNRVWRPRLG
jgi:cellulose synthase/poly-beta-1,6-N-acetylglucosamine synthase-like glycosyltransferase